MKGIGTITYPKTNDRTEKFKLKQEKVAKKMFLATTEAKKALKALGVAMSRCCPMLAKIKYKPHRLRSAVGLKRNRGKTQ